jgi:hypothetical protein
MVVEMDESASWCELGLEAAQAIPYVNVRLTQLLPVRRR